MLEMAKKSSFIMVPPISKGEMYLKSILHYIVLACYEIFFNFIWLLFKGHNMVKLQFFAIPNIHTKY